MLRRLRVKIHSRRMMFCNVGGTDVRAGRWRRYRRRIGAVRASFVCLIDRVQRMAMGHHREMCGVNKVSTVLEMPRRLAMMSRGLLVVRRRGFEMTLLTVLRIHTGSSATSGLTPMATDSKTQWRVANCNILAYISVTGRSGSDATKGFTYA